MVALEWTYVVWWSHGGDEMIKVESVVEVYEHAPDAEHGLEEIKGLKRPKLVFKSHWNQDDRFTICLESGERFTVLRKDVEAAVRNCTDVARF